MLPTFAAKLVNPAAPAHSARSSMKKSNLETILAGGDRRSIGRSNEIVSMVLRQPHHLHALVDCLRSDDPLVSMRAADALEKISARKIELVEPHKAELLELMETAGQQELRWHLAQIVPRLALTRKESERAAASLWEYLSDKSSIVKTFALQGLADLARLDPSLRRSVKNLLEQSRETGTQAMKARARKLLAKMP
jgi:hypothetical protein